MSEIPRGKAELRSAMRAERKRLTLKQQTRDAQAVYEYIRAFEPYRRARCVMGYMACRGELSLEPVLSDVLAGGRALALPRCEAGNTLTARRVQALSKLRTGAFGLPEPDEGDEIVPNGAIGVVFVPGTAFGMDGTRIGQGGGYYDRFLADTRALRVGVCHDFARFKSVPSDAHDQRMDYLITPSGIFACR